MLAAEKLFTSLFAAFAAFVIWQSYSYGIVSSTITGPGFFPAIAGLIMLLSAGASLVSKRPAAHSVSGEEANGALSGGRIEVLRVALLVGFTALFIILSPFIGMIALTPFYVFACFLALTPDFRPLRLMLGAVTAVLFTILAWAIFDKSLGVPMPRGLF